MAEEATTTTDNSAEDTSNESTTVTDNGTTDEGDNSATSTSTEGATDSGNADETTTTEEAPATKFDADLDVWAEKTGRTKPDTDRERELYQEIRDGQRKFSVTQASRKMGKAIDELKPNASEQDEDDEEDPLVKETRALREQFQDERNLRLRSEFFTANEISDSEGDAIADIFKEKVDKSGEAAFDYWSHPDNLQDLLDLARARIGSESKTDVEEVAARKERERISKESKANGPNRNASTTTTSSKTEDEERLERFSNWDK